VKEEGEEQARFDVPGTLVGKGAGRGHAPQGGHPPDPRPHLAAGAHAAHGAITAARLVVRAAVLCRAAQEKFLLFVVVAWPCHSGKESHSRALFHMFRRNSAEQRPPDMAEVSHRLGVKSFFTARSRAT
jgi:hypothetical protein